MGGTEYKPVPWGSLFAVLVAASLFLPSAPFHLSMQLTTTLMFICFTLLLASYISIAKVISVNTLSQNESIVVKLLSVLLLYVGAQLIPLPASLMRQISPFRDQVWERGAYGINGMSTVSLDISATIWFLMMLFCYISVFLITLKLSSNRFYQIIIASGIFLLGISQVLFDLLTKYYGYRYISISEIDGHIFRLTGTFVNSNNLSALLNLSIGSGLALIASISCRLGQGGRYYKILALILLSAGLVLLFYGSIQAGSSGGFLSFFVAISITVIVLIFSRLSYKLIVGLIGIGVIMIVLLWLFGSQELNVQQLAQRDSLDSRIVIWNDVIRMWKEFPLFGIGAGAFEWIYPAYKSELANPLKVATAHNGYLHLLAEIGLVGFVLFLSILVILFMSVIQSMRTNLSGSLVTGMYLAGILAFLIQEVVETNLLIPGVSIPFFSLLAMALANSSSCRGNDR